MVIIQDLLLAMNSISKRNLIFSLSQFRWTLILFMQMYILYGKAVRPSVLLSVSGIKLCFELYY